MSTVESNTPKPSLGRIVHYTLNEFNAEYINETRKTSGRGNPVNAGEVYPLMISRVWSSGPNDLTPETPVNGQVFLDGTDTLWVSSVVLGDGPGHFAWPARV